MNKNTGIFPVFLPAPKHKKIIIPSENIQKKKKKKIHGELKGSCVECFCWNADYSSGLLN